jgi:hypothetical protein
LVTSTPVDRWQDGEAVRQKIFIGQRWIRVANRADGRAAIVDFDQSAGLAVHHRRMVGVAAVIDELKAGENVAVGEAQETVRHAEPAEALEAGGYLWRQRISEVENH